MMKALNRAIKACRRACQPGEEGLEIRGAFKAEEAEYAKANIDLHNGS